MKKALKINLNGRIFHIDEDAYDKLKKYLDTISSHFSNSDDSKEILADIETRIAELLEEKLRDNSQIITIQQVDEIIEIMGRPEEIADDENPQDNKSYHYESSGRQYKKLYRDPDNAVFGGVASGLAAYFGIDILIVRILFVVLILAGAGFPFILYLVLWIAIPKAITAAEKLEMKGEKVNVSNIEKKIREEYEGAKENFSKARNSSAGKRTENAFQEIFRVLGIIIVGLLKVVLAFIAVGFIIAGISLIASLIGFVFVGAGATGWGLFHIWDTDFHSLIVPFINPVNVSFIGISAILLVLIPVLAIIYGLFKALFKFKAKDKALGSVAFALWFLALFAVITLGFMEIKQYSNNEEVVNNISFSDFTGDTMVLDMNIIDEEFDVQKEEFGFNDYQYFIGNNEDVYGEILIDFRKSNSDLYEMKIEKSSRGQNYSEALKFAENINYQFSLSDNTLKLDPYFHSEYDNKWRFQTVNIKLYIPEGKFITFDNDVAGYIDYIKNENNYSPMKMADKYWMMKEGRFTR